MTILDLTKKIPNQIEFKIHQNETEMIGLNQSFVEIFPRNSNELSIILSIFSDKKMHTVSTGKNWGMGSNFPPQGVDIVLNLEKLNSIIRYNSDFGYMEIEPGVTQKYISDYLKNEPWYLDVTGSGAETSVMGNALVRGISYNYYRVDRVMKVRGFNKKGEFQESGFKGDNPICHLYKWGIGPDILGLFFQNKDMFATSITIKLDARPECMETFSLNFNESKLEAVFGILKSLKQKQLLPSNVHIANFERYFPVIASNLNARLNLTEDEILKKLKNLFSQNTWMGSGSIMGHPQIVKEQKKILKSKFKDVAQVRFMSPRKLSFLKWITKFFTFPSTLLDVISDLQGFSIGNPSDCALGAMAWPTTKSAQFKHLDKGDWGALFISPVGPYDPKKISDVIFLIQKFAKTYDFSKAAITVNAPGGEVAEFVISLHYIKKMAPRAIECFKQLEAELNELGFYSYRLGSWQL